MNATKRERLEKRILHERTFNLRGGEKGRGRIRATITLVQIKSRHALIMGRGVAIRMRGDRHNEDRARDISRGRALKALERRRPSGMIRRDEARDAVTSIKWGDDLALGKMHPLFKGQITPLLSPIEIRYWEQGR